MPIRAGGQRFGFRRFFFDNTHDNTQRFIFRSCFKAIPGQYQAALLFPKARMGRVVWAAVL